MRTFPSYAALLRQLPTAARRGPVGLVLVQDDVGVAEGFAHLDATGVPVRIALGEAALVAGPATHHAPFDVHRPGALAAAANALSRALPGTWILPLWNGERLVWPYMATRPLPALLSFLEEERRATLGGVVLDSYRDGGTGWQIDAMGYSQVEGAIHGGLRDRLGAPCPAAGRRLDRPLAVCGGRGVRWQADGRLTDPELNRLHSAWHCSPVAALISPRVWAWLRSRPAQLGPCVPLLWPGSMPFGGTSRELWELGMIAPGQWV